MNIDSVASVCALIVNFKTPDLTLKCVEALARERDMLPQLKAMVVDNASGDGSAEMLNNAFTAAPFANWVQFVPLPINGGFGWGNNQAAIRLLQGSEPPEFLYLINPDAIIDPGAISSLLTHFKRPRVAAAGSRLVDQRNALTGSAFRFPSIAGEFVAGSHTPALGRMLGVPATVVRTDVATPVDWVTGASVIFRADALREVGLFDDSFFLYFEEVELMRRLGKAGWEIWHEPESQVRHIGGAATGVGTTEELAARARPAYWYRSRKRYFARSGGRTAVLLANLAWLAGNLLWRVRKKLGSGRGHVETLNETRDLIANGLTANRSDLTPSIAHWNDMPNRPPGWMQGQ